MADENTPLSTSTQNATSQDIGTPSVSLDATEEKSLASNVASPISEDATKHEDRHDVPHPHFRWHADVLVDGHDIYHGVMKDISMKGASLLLDHSLQNTKLIKLHILVPPLDVTSPHHVMAVSGKINSTVYDGTEFCFRSGVTFNKFTLESDKALLQARLTGY